VISRARRCVLVLAAVLAAAALLVPASAAAKREWPRRLFVLVPSADLGNRPLVNGYAFDRFIQDVAEAPDGSILLATDRGWPPREGEVLRLTPGGRLRTLGRLTDGVRAIAANSGGSVLVLQDNRVLRLLPSGGSIVIAGTGQAGFSGDGGPATAATMDVGSDMGAGGGIARAPDGSIVFTDSSNHRLRRIRSDGVIETIAGIGIPPGEHFGCQIPPSTGDGGPARLATLCVPSDVIVAADGGYIVADTRAHRVRRIAPDGTITTIVGTGSGTVAPGGGVGMPATQVSLSFPRNVVQLPNGTIVVSAAFGYARVLPDGKWYSLFKDFGSSVSDFTGRGPGITTAITATAEGGLLMGTGGLYELATRQARRALAHISGARVDDDHLAVSVDASRAARATLRVRLRGRTVARATRSIRAGRQRLEVGGRFAARRHNVRVTVRARNGTVSSDDVALYLGGTLTMKDARAAIKLELFEGSIQSCRRITRRRITCTIVDDFGERLGSDTARLGLDGVIR
jgi:hypothetical protein